MGLSFFLAAQNVIGLSPHTPRPNASEGNPCKPYQYVCTSSVVHSSHGNLRQFVFTYVGGARYTEGYHGCPYTISMSEALFMSDRHHKACYAAHTAVSNTKHDDNNDINNIIRQLTRPPPSAFSFTYTTVRSIRC